MREIQRVSPINGEALSPVAMSTELEVKEAITLARAAQPAWHALGFEARAKLVRQGARRMLEKRAEIVVLGQEEVGKYPTEMLMTEALGPLEFVSAWIKQARHALKRRTVPVSSLAFPGKSAKVELVPRGVVGIIAPWNFPLANFFKGVFPALLCGNAVVVKPSEFTPKSGQWFVDVMNEILPPHVLQAVQGDGEVGRALTVSGIDALTFTGSVNTGRKVAQLAAERLIPVSLELGGKDPAIVLADCAFDRTVAGIMQWSLANAGQSCAAIERVYVIDAIAEKFAAAMGNAVARLRSEPGAEVDVMPLQNLKQLELVTAQVNDAVAKGAVVRAGAKPLGRGFWFAPTVLDRCTHEMRIMTEETFGPVVCIARVKDEDEAVRLANDSTFGLNASVWSCNLTHAEALARRLEAGVVLVNNHSITGAWPQAAWTGVKNTGYGIAGSEFALHTFTRPMTVVVDKNSAPDAWWLPVDATLLEIANRLGEVQLGALLRAVALPFLMRQRAKTILAFARGSTV